MTFLVTFECFLRLIANLGLIDFQMGLSININVNDGQNKFKVHISKIWPEWQIFGLE